MTSALQEAHTILAKIINRCYKAELGSIMWEARVPIALVEEARHILRECYHACSMDLDIEQAISRDLPTEDQLKKEI